MKSNHNYSIKYNKSHFENLTLDLGYRYLDAGKFEDKSSTEGTGSEIISMKLKAHDI